MVFDELGEEGPLLTRGLLNRLEADVVDNEGVVLVREWVGVTLEMMKFTTIAQERKIHT